MKRASLLLLSILLAACASGHYESPQLAARSARHETIAVLPFEMIFTGKAPRDLSLNEILAIEEAESVAFQAAFYDRLLYRSSVRRKNPILVEIQPVATTNRLLAEKGIGVRQSWAMRPERLAQVLGVDAVVRTTVIKTRYLSAAASYGIDVGLHVAHEVTEGVIGGVIPVPPEVTKTHDIHIESMLCDGDGAVLWKVGVDRATDWTRPANDIIAGVTGKLAKKFPYRRG